MPPFGLLVLLAWRLLRPELWRAWVGLPLGLPAELEEIRAEAELRPLRDQGACRASDDGAEYLPREGSELETFALGGLSRAVAQRHVGHFMRQHAREFFLG